MPEETMARGGAEPDPAVAAGPPADEPTSMPRTGEAESTRPEKPAVESPGLLSDCRLMLSYARKNGFELPTELLHEIAWLDGVLRTFNISPLSAISSVLVTALTPDQLALGFRANAADPVAAAADSLSPEEMILKLHGELSTLIAPTTALSLQTSEPPPGRWHIFGGMPPLVESAIWIALFSAFIFIVSAAVIGHDAGVAEDKRKADERAAVAAATKALEAAIAGGLLPKATQAKTAASPSAPAASATGGNP